MVSNPNSIRLSAAVLCCAAAAYSQNLTGRWAGQASQYDNGLEFVVEAWIMHQEENGLVRSELALGVYRALRAAHIEMAVPQRDVRLRPASNGADPVTFKNCVSAHQVGLCFIRLCSFSQIFLVGHSFPCHILAVWLPAHRLFHCCVG